MILIPEKIIYAQKQGVKDGLDCDDQAFGGRGTKKYRIANFYNFGTKKLLL